MSRFRNTVLSVAVALLVLALAGACFAQEKETKLPGKDVPAAVMTAFHNAYPKAEIKGTAKEVENGKTYFEIESIDGGMSRDLLYLADGTVTEIEEAVDPATLPAPVKAAAEAKYPQGKIVKAERTTRDAATTYDLQIMSGKTKENLTLGPDGKAIIEHKSAAGPDKAKSPAKAADKPKG
ncbi:MAG: PepSY-like domain-containing protein [Candidatus Krumholzibacteriia bacterium]